MVHGNVTVGGQTSHVPRLPGVGAGFVGRVEVLRELLGVIERHDPAGLVLAIHAIDGMAGVGKTELALRVAHAVAGRYSDGAVFLDLAGYTPGLAPMTPQAALRRLLVAIGGSVDTLPEDIAELRAAWRQQTEHRKLLLVLDNVADCEQVAPLLPGAAGCLVLITSRRKLIGLPHVTPFALDVLSFVEARQLLVSITGGDPTADAVGRVVALCGRLPLAITIAAAIVRHRAGYDIAMLADDLAEERRSLDAIATDDDSLHAAVHTSIALSYRDLSPQLKQAFRRCGLHPGPEITESALAALTTIHDGECAVHLTTIAVTRARRVLLGLVDRNLLQPSQASEFGPRYRQHDLIRASARLCLHEDPEPQRRHDLTHLGRACLATLEHVESWRYGGNLPTRMVTESEAVLVRVADYATARRWVGVERENLLAVVDALDDRCGPVAQLLAASLTDLGHLAQARHCYERAYASYTKLGLDPFRAHVLRGLAAADTQVGDYSAARQNYQRAMAISRRRRDRTGQALALRGLGNIHRLTDNYEAACACFRRSLRLLDDQIHAQPDDMMLRRYRALTLTALGTIEQMYHRTSVALGLLRRADHDFAVVGDTVGRSTVLCQLAEADRAAGDLAAARAKFAEVLALAQRLAEPDLVAEALWGLGQVAKDEGDYTVAAALFRDITAFDGIPVGSLQHTTALLALAETARFSQQWDEARVLYEEARRACETLRDRQGVAEALAGLGFSANATGQSEQAQDYFRLAIVGYEEIGHPFGPKLRRYLGPR